MSQIITKLGQDNQNGSLDVAPSWYLILGIIFGIIHHVAVTLAMYVKIVPQNDSFGLFLIIRIHSFCFHIY
jgi:hypothetical protein